MTLVPYTRGHAASVVAWCAASPYSAEWVSDPDPDALLASWHADPDISGHLLLRAGTPVAYGELWVERDEDEAELAHLVVDPALRGQGLGRELTLALVERAREFANVYLRVHGENAVGIGLYRSVGFVRVSAEDEASFNAGQPAEYQWMQLP